MYAFFTQFIKDFWLALTEMAPYLLFGFMVAGIISQLISTRFVRDHIGGSGFLPVFKASAFGVPLPLCSCGVLPVAMSLRRSGAARAGTVSFLLSTPQTGIDSVMVTWSLLGGVFAIFRPVIAFITGVLGGVFMSAADNEQSQNGGPGPEKTPKRCEKCGDSCSGGTDCQGPNNASALKKGFGSRIKDMFHHGFVTLPQDIARPLMLGVVIAALVSVFVPDDFFAEKLPPGIWSMILMLFFGMPLYVCSAASVPLAAAMISKGLSPGAAMVFLMTGPATNAATFLTIWRILGKKAGFIYIGTVVFCAIGSGLLLNAMFPDLGARIATDFHQMKPVLVGHISAIILLIVLIWAILPQKITDRVTKAAR